MSDTDKPSEREPTAEEIEAAQAFLTEHAWSRENQSVLRAAVSDMMARYANHVARAAVATSASEPFVLS